MTRIKKERAREEKSMETTVPIRTHFEDGTPASLEPYRRHLDHLDLSYEAKTALLVSVRQIMSSFVDRAFGDDPVQHIRAEGSRPLAKDALGRSSVVGSLPSTNKPQNTRLARAFATPAARRGKEPS